MGKMNSFSIIAGIILIFSSATAMAGSPYAIPASGTQFKPHVANPSLTQNPVVNRSVGHARQPVHSVRKYTATTKVGVRRQGVVSAGGASWNCRGNRCTTKTAWTRPTVQSCKALASAVGAIQSYGRRGAGLNAGELLSCNAGIAVARSKRKAKTASAFNSNLATKAPVRGSFAPPQGNRRVLNASPPAGGGFAPAIKVPPSIRNHGKAPANLLRHRSGGGFSPRAPLVSVNPGNAEGNLLKNRGGSRAATGMDGKSLLTSHEDSSRSHALSSHDNQNSDQPTINTGPLTLVGARSTPYTVRTGPLVLSNVAPHANAQVAAGSSQGVVINTGPLTLVGARSTPYTVRTGPLILTGEPH